jgi:hypothetical protein
MLTTTMVCLPLHVGDSGIGSTNSPGEMGCMIGLFIHYPTEILNCRLNIVLHIMERGVAQ